MGDYVEEVEIVRQSDVMRSVIDDDVDAVHELLHRCPALVGMCDRTHGQTALFYVRSAKMTALWLEHGEDPNAVSVNGATPLWYAVSSDLVDVAETMIAHGAHVNDATEDRDTPIFMAKSAQMVELLVARGAEANLVGGGRRTAVHSAVHRGCTGAMVALLEHGAAADVYTEDGFSALHTAALLDNTNATRALLDRGVPADRRCLPVAMGATPLHLTAFHGGMRTALLLLARGANVDARTMTGELAEDIARDRGHVELVALLGDARRQRGPPRLCGYCGAPESGPERRLRMCERCRSVRYCSAECSQAGWRWGHKAECRRAAFSVVYHGRECQMMGWKPAKRR